VLGQTVAEIHGERRLHAVTLDDGRRLAADAFVFACGPWLPDLFPALLGDLIVPHRQDVMQFAVPAGDGRYGADAMPVWIDFGGSFYGFPSFDGVGLKACPDWLGPIERPDASAREVAESSIEASRAVLRKRFPALAAQPMVKTWTCFYEVTPDAHFVIDRHPDLGNAWIAGGGTGHAFKHGPVIGDRRRCHRPVAAGQHDHLNLRRKALQLGKRGGSVHSVEPSTCRYPDRRWRQTLPNWYCIPCGQSPSLGIR